MGTDVDYRRKTCCKKVSSSPAREEEDKEKTRSPTYENLQLDFYGGGRTVECNSTN